MTHPPSAPPSPPPSPGPKIQYADAVHTADVLLQALQVLADRTLRGPHAAELMAVHSRLRLTRDAVHDLAEKAGIDLPVRRTALSPVGGLGTNPPSGAGRASGPAAAEPSSAAGESDRVLAAPVGGVSAGGVLAPACTPGAPFSLPKPLGPPEFAVGTAVYR